ncbi:hypothetical protein GCM10027425_18040 [Alteromonas gracilis]
MDLDPADLVPGGCTDDLRERARLLRRQADDVEHDVVRLRPAVAAAWRSTAADRFDQVLTAALQEVHGSADRARALADRLEGLADAVELRRAALAALPGGVADAVEEMARRV